MPSRHTRAGRAPEGHGPARSPRSAPSTERVIALFVLGVLVLNYPLLSVIDHQNAGQPWLWFGLFAIWAVFIVLIRVLHSPSRGRRRRD